MNEYYTQIITAGVTLGVAFIANYFGFLGKRKSKHDEDIEDDKWLMEKNKQIFSMLENRLLDAEKEIQDIREIFDRYKSNAESEIKSLKEEVGQLRDENVKYKSKFGSL